MATVRRLWLGLAVSLALHLALLGLAPRHPRPAFQDWYPAPPLRVELRPMPAPDRPPPPRQHARPPPATVATAVSAPPPAGEPAPTPPVAVAEAPAAATVQLDLTALYAAARAQARQDTPPPRREAPAPEDRPILPAFARALRREAAGERRLADGLIRVVAADGHAYCLLAPPGAARGGPADPLAVPVTCP